MLINWYSVDGIAVHPLLVVLFAFAVDAAMGDPPGLYRRVPHPVALFGKLASKCEEKLNRDSHKNSRQLLYGAVLTVVLVGLAAGIGYGVQTILSKFDYGWVAGAVLASSLIAYRGLHDRARAVAHGLETSPVAGREAVSHLVGRDPDSLDDHGVARAAIESTAENLSDAVVAPLLWFSVLGLPGLCACKAVNTLDSMIGHHTVRYEYFGKFAAGLDDAVNAIPARITGLLIVTAAAFGRKTRAGAAWSAMSGDAARHRSRNAGWPEAAMAGALGLALAGPRRYEGRVVEDAWMNAKGRREATPDDIRHALRVYRAAAGLLGALLLLTMALA